MDDLRNDNNEVHEHYCPVCELKSECTDPECSEPYHSECIYCLRDGARDLSA